MNNSIKNPKGNFTLKYCTISDTKSKNHCAIVSNNGLQLLWLMAEGLVVLGIIVNLCGEFTHQWRKEIDFLLLNINSGGLFLYLLTVLYSNFLFVVVYQPHQCSQRSISHALVLYEMNLARDFFLVKK